MKLVIWALFIAFVFTSNGCINNVEDITSDVPIDPNDVSYLNDIQPIFNSSCAGSGCHINTTNFSNGVNLTNYNSVMNSVGAAYGTNIVMPGEPDQSPIVDKIEPNPENGVRMPSTGEYLTTEEIETIKAWIEGGAEDN